MAASVANCAPQSLCQAQGADPGRGATLVRLPCTGLLDGARQLQVQTPDRSAPPKGSGHDLKVALR